MYENLWINTYKSICSIQHWKDTEKIASGTGFLIDGCLITNNHVYDCSQSNRIIIEFVEQDGSTIRFKKEFNKNDFVATLKTGSSKENWDYAILKIEDFKNFPSLKLCQSHKELSIGMPIGLLGYQFGNSNLSIHSGMISSKFSKGNIKYIQIDASVNQGNSGGPLIDLQTGEVIWIITRAANGLSIIFDELINSFWKNIEALRLASGIMSLGPVDPIEVLIVSQRQMELISKDIKRSANVWIGYAFALDQIREDFEN